MIDLKVVQSKIISILMSLWLATLILYMQQKTNQTIISTDRKFRRQNTSVLAKLGNGDIVRQLILNRFNAYPILSDVFVVLKRIILKLVNNNKGHTKTVLNFIHELFDVDKEVLEKVSTESKTLT